MINPMSLTGGLDMYNFPGRYKSSVPPEGRKVVFLDDNGYDIQREYARQFFAKGDVLTVKEIYVGGGSSTVEFIEFPGKKFNTVMFAEVEEGGIPNAD
jgi:hypothetical protein